MLRPSVDQQQAMTAVVDERLRLLKEKSFEYLATLNKTDSEEIIVAGKKVVISTWHEQSFSGEHLIVVQVYKPWMLGIGRMYVNGFAVNPKNERRELTQEEKVPFT